MTERTDITPILVDEERRATREAIIEAAARAIFSRQDEFYTEYQRQLACDVLAAVTPLIRAATLEEAAKVADGCSGKIWCEIADRIRALKEQP